jgi:hypothetical protein
MADNSQLSGTKLYLILPRSGETSLFRRQYRRNSMAPLLWWNDINVWGLSDPALLDSEERGPGTPLLS